MNRGPGRSTFTTRTAGAVRGGSRSGGGGGGRHAGGRSATRTTWNNTGPTQQQQQQPYHFRNNNNNNNNNNNRNNYRQQQQQQQQQQYRHYGGPSGRRYGPPEDMEHNNSDRIEEIGIPSNDSVTIAIEGCCHGQITAIYDRLQRYEEQQQQEEEHDNNNNNATAGAAVSASEDTTETIELKRNTDGLDGLVVENATEDATIANRKKKKKKIDLLICCGDFQSLRTPADFHSLAVPSKYREMGSFYRYYNQEWIAPILTIFIGGNHEASQPLSELYYGGWVAPNIYYLGVAGVVQYKGIRIGGLSGIYKSHDHYQPRHEIPPYTPHQLRSIYHYRNVDVYRLSCLRRRRHHMNDSSTRCSTETKEEVPTRSSHDLSQQQQQPSSLSSSSQHRNDRILDIMISHDWPQGIEQYGNVHDLIRRKPFFRQEIQENTLGSPPASFLLHTIQPKYWFAAHLHVKFHAQVIHNPPPPPPPPPPANANARNIINHPKENSTLVTQAAAAATMLVPSQVVRMNANNQAQQKSAQTSSSLSSSNEPKNIISSVNDSYASKNNASSSEQQQASLATTTHFHVPESSTTEAMSCPNTTPDLTELMTQFLSLDKCLPRRQYLSIVHIPVDPSHVSTTTTTTSQSDDNDRRNNQLEYDLEWLAILRKTHHLASLQNPCRDFDRNETHTVSDEEMYWIQERVGMDRTIPENFIPTLPQSQRYDGNTTTDWRNATKNPPPPPLPRMGNPQTDQLLELLQLEHLPNLTIPYRQNDSVVTSLSYTAGNGRVQEEAQQELFLDKDDNEIDLDDDDDDVPVALHSDTVQGDNHQDRHGIGLSDGNHNNNKNNQDTTTSPVMTEPEVVKKPRLGENDD